MIVYVMKQLRHNIHLIILSAILLFSFITRIYNVNIPEKYYFDEVYHAVTAKLYARNDPSGYEWWHEPPEPNTAIEWLHPPLAKLTQAFGILVFGENSFGWRISSVVFGTLVILLIYILAKKLTDSKNIGLIAAFLASLDGLLFAQSRIAMNDIHLTFFVLLSIIVYQQYKERKTNIWLLLSGIVAGLSMSSKWSGVFVLGVFFADQFFTFVRERKTLKKKHVAQLLFAWIIIPVIVYILSFTQFWIQGHTFEQFKELHNQIWQYQVNLKATHPRQSRPLEWMFDVKPVWFYVDYSKDNEVANIYNVGNPVLFIGGLISLFYLFYSLIFMKMQKKEFSNIVLLLLSYVIIWTPWFFSPRIMFFYHYTPAVPFLCIGLSITTYELIRSNAWRTVGLSVIFMSIFWFVLFFPYISGIHMPNEFVKSIYQIIPTWK